MEWDEPCDVDLYVTDPAHRTFYFSQKTYSGSKAELSIDMVYGPGVEVWQNPEAVSGDYLVRYREGGNCPALGSGQSTDFVTVKGWIVDRSHGMRMLKPQTLTRSRFQVDAATIHVGIDGLTTILAGQD
jgi:hypothetical protein